MTFGITGLLSVGYLWLLEIGVDEAPRRLAAHLARVWERRGADARRVRPVAEPGRRLLEQAGAREHRRRRAVRLAARASACSARASSASCCCAYAAAAAPRATAAAVRLATVAAALVCGCRAACARRSISAARDTGGAFCLLVDHPPAGWSLPAHRHLGEAETIHVIDGEFEIELRRHAHASVSAGETIHVPRGVMHASANVGEQSGSARGAVQPRGARALLPGGWRPTRRTATSTWRRARAAPPATAGSSPRPATVMRRGPAPARHPDSRSVGCAARRLRRLAPSRQRCGGQDPGRDRGDSRNRQPRARRRSTLQAQFSAQASRYQSTWSSLLDKGGQGRMTLDGVTHQAGRRRQRRVRRPATPPSTRASPAPPPRGMLRGTWLKGQRRPGRCARSPRSPTWAS